MSEMAEAIRQLIQEKGYSEESVRQTIERALKAAYKRTYGTDENAIVKFEDDMSDVKIYSRKVVVDGVYDPVKEIDLEDAQKLSSEIEEGDEVDIIENPKEYYLTYLLISSFGAVLGFILFNLHPSKLFMGDSGSLSLGALLGVSSLILHREFFLIISGGLFIFETLSVILQVTSYKLFKKRIFFMSPFHHHL